LIQISNNSPESGIGLAIVESLATTGKFKDSPLFVILAARDSEKGAAALKTLTDKGLKNVGFQVLDVTDQKSIESAVADIKKNYGSLDILINNAGIAFKGDAFDETVASGTLDTNYFGVLAVRLPLPFFFSFLLS
jgi:carbonyl reductase 1